MFSKLEQLLTRLARDLSNKTIMADDDIKNYLKLLKKQMLKV